MEPIVKQQFEIAKQYVADECVRRYGSFAEVMLFGSLQLQSKIGSPLEMLFCLWWFAVQEATNDYELGMIPQEEVLVDDHLYRVDFLVVPTEFGLSCPQGWQPIAVELDGHAFHERTREQVQLRDSRDRALTAAGWKVFHFSFSEFTSKPVECIKEVFEYAGDQFDRIKGK